MSRPGGAGEHRFATPLSQNVPSRLEGRLRGAPLDPLSLDLSDSLVRTSGVHHQRGAVTMKSLSATGMARHNRDLILNLLRREKILSRHEIRSRVGASPAKANRLTTQLIERGPLKAEGNAARTDGRPSTLLRLAVVG